MNENNLNAANNQTPTLDTPSVGANNINNSINENPQIATQNHQNEPKIIKTDTGNKDGQNKCPKCGATDISLNTNTGNLRCNFCRNEFQSEKIEGLENDLTKLEGQILASGATDIIADTNDILTFKCSSCGAEVVIDTSESTQARCHWCRNILSVNNQIPNGAIPDVVLPFKLSKEEAKKQIENFVGKRKFFAHPKFKNEFTTQNIMGVYFPYMIVDINSHATLTGKGEKQIRRYTRGTGENAKTYYDADLYEISRDFDLIIDGLSVESSLDKLNKNNKSKTTNVINAVMPFDIQNCIKYNSNYLKGYTSEKRDTNIEQIKPLVEEQSKDIARFAAGESIKEYDRGVAWDNESLQIKGQQWKAAYLPVWLYSYQQVSNNNKILHYVAVNARTKETMGSVPIHMPKLFLISFLVEILSLILIFFVDFDYEYLFLLSGPIYFTYIYFKYRNSNARHKHELETKKQIINLKKHDNFIRRETELTSPKIQGANNTKVSSASMSSQMIDSLINQNEVTSFIKNNINGGNKQ